ncbi:hypothetical protein IWX49DRAFT_358999 [Phyllosticta citricarpa]|uniref:Transmembrane protein n=1 Tax=Phyllosticta paracitricarpa TaxID=2016321 RepID=A0ABR1MSX2_9PEZI
MSCQRKQPQSLDLETRDAYFFFFRFDFGLFPFLVFDFVVLSFLSCLLFPFFFSSPSFLSSPTHSQSPRCLRRRLMRAMHVAMWEIWWLATDRELTDRPTDRPKCRRTVCTQYTTLGSIRSAPMRAQDKRGKQQKHWIVLLVVVMAPYACSVGRSRRLLELARCARQRSRTDVTKID